MNKEIIDKYVNNDHLVLEDGHSEKPNTPEGLDEAAEKFVRDNDTTAQNCCNCMRQVFKAGAEWDRSQMMQEAVEIEWKSGTMKKGGKEVPFEGGKAKIIIVALED